MFKPFFHGDVCLFSLAELPTARSWINNRNELVYELDPLLKNLKVDLRCKELKQTKCIVKTCITEVD